MNIIEDGTAQTLTSRMGTGGGNVPLVMTYTEADESNQRERERERVMGADFQNGLLTGDKSMTMLASRSDPHSVPCVVILKERCE